MERFFRGVSVCVWGGSPDRHWNGRAVTRLTDTPKKQPKKTELSLLFRAFVIFRVLSPLIVPVAGGGASAGIDLDPPQHTLLHFYIFTPVPSSIHEQHTKYLQTTQSASASNRSPSALPIIVILPVLVIVIIDIPTTTATNLIVLLLEHGM